MGAEAQAPLGADRTSLVGQIVHGKPRGAAGRVAAGLLRGISWGYRGGLEANLLGYRLGVLRRRRLDAFVVSVGNLTSGGTGKTCATHLIARALMQAGVATAVLSRGHGGSGPRGVASDGAQVLMTAEQSGDEAAVTARALPGVPVLVGKDRRATGARAIGEFGAQALVLDDGFQYWRLVKDYEIVLVDALSPFGNGHLLPRGLLREPPEHVRRCDAVWITHADLAEAQALDALRERLRGLHPAAALGFARHRPTAMRDFHSRSEIPLSRLGGMRVAALSSIGSPEAFELTAERLGADVMPIRFPDHHAYSSSDVERVCAWAKGRAEAILTTEKDAVRLPAVERALPTWVLGVEIEVEPPEAVSRITAAALQGHGGGDPFRVTRRAARGAQ